MFKTIHLLLALQTLAFKHFSSNRTLLFECTDSFMHNNQPKENNVGCFVKLMKSWCRKSSGKWGKGKANQFLCQIYYIEEESRATKMNNCVRVREEGLVTKNWEGGSNCGIWYLFLERRGFRKCSLINCILAWDIMIIQNKCNFLALKLNQVHPFRS